jgi:hypothetical protein
MKKYCYIGIILAVVTFSSCIKQLEKKFTGTTVAEIDATVLNSVAAGVTFPILTRIPPAGRPVSTTVDSTLRRWSGTVKIRINLVGPQSGQEQTVGYTIFNSPITSVAFPATLTATQAPPTGQTPAQPAATLAVTDAVAGTHFAPLSGKAVFPANSSFAFIDLNVLNNGAAAGQARFLGIRLDSSGTVMPSVNYRSLGLVIDQR